MLRLAALPLIVLFAAPGDSAPESAFQEIVNHARKEELQAVWDALAPAAQARLGRGLREQTGAGEDADMREVLKAWQAKVKKQPDNPLQLLATLKVTVEKVERKADTAVLAVHAAVAGFPKRGRAVMVLHEGRWKLADFKPPEAAEPDVRSARANELAAIATLRMFVSAQAQFQAAGVVDANGNGHGEYGTLAEMAGSVPMRGRKDKLNPPVLPDVFGKAEGGRVTRHGYHFRVHLPGPAGVAVDEKDGAAKIDPKLAEVVWCAYAWPVEAGTTGTRAFFVNQMGDVWTTEAGAYSGDKGPSPYAVFPPDEAGRGATTILRDLIPGKRTSDGRSWKVER